MRVVPSFVGALIVLILPTVTHAEVLLLVDRGDSVDVGIELQRHILGYGERVVVRPPVDGDSPLSRAEAAQELAARSGARVAIWLEDQIVVGIDSEGGLPVEVELDANDATGLATSAAVVVDRIVADQALAQSVELEGLDENPYGGSPPRNPLATTSRLGGLSEQLESNPYGPTVDVAGLESNPYFHGDGELPTMEANPYLQSRLAGRPALEAPVDPAPAALDRNPYGTVGGSSEPARMEMNPYDAVPLPREPLDDNPYQSHHPRWLLRGEPLHVA